MPIKIEQLSTLTGRHRWKWSVWLDGTAAELDSVEYVIYTLHPTFSEPVRRVGERETAFRLYSAGWGEFNIHAAVHFRDGRVQQLDHWLTLFSDVDQWLRRAGGSSSHGVPHRAAKPRVYLSYSVAEAPAVKAIFPLLRQEGVEVTTSDDIAEMGPEMSSDKAIMAQLRSVSCAVFFISGFPNPWFQREREIALSLAIPLAFITTTDTPMPDVARAIARLARIGT
jgi:hypothetical protein